MWRLKIAVLAIMQSLWYLMASMAGEEKSVTIVCITKLSKADFWEKSFLGRCLGRIPVDMCPGSAIVYDSLKNKEVSLPSFYNQQINGVSSNTILAFIRDDVYLHDLYIKQRIIEAMERFDIAGVVGSINPDFKQPSWELKFDANFKEMGRQPDLLCSGVVGYGDYHSAKIISYGEAPQRCALLDGMFLIAKASRLKEKKIMFDERFSRYLYDLDFCRQALSAELRLGTFSISVTRKSRPSLEGAAFRQAADRYLFKWQAEPKTPSIS